MPTLLFVHHSPSDAVAGIREAMLAGATDDAIEDVEVVVRPALEDADDPEQAAATVRDADAVLLLTTANFGYMSGALKHWFDVTFPLLEGQVDGRPYALVVKGNTDGTGAIRAVESIATGLGWSRARPPLELLGAPADDDLARCRELAAELAAALSMGML